jgi:hypothetical protein
LYEKFLSISEEFIEVILIIIYKKKKLQKERGKKNLLRGLNTLMVLFARPFIICDFKPV